MGCMNAPNPPYVNQPSARFIAACQRVLRTEGGFVNDAADSGGATNYGISLRFLTNLRRVDPALFEHFDLGITGDIDVSDIRDLTPDEARLIYWHCFWLRAECEEFPAPMGEMLFDQAGNGGLLAARRLLQQAINRCTATYAHITGCPGPIAVDGDAGPATMAAFTWVLALPAAGMPALIGAYRAAAANHYRAIAAADPSQRKFLDGWLNRAANLGRNA